MCRLLAYAGTGEDLVAELAGAAPSLRSLAREHGDGWGIAAWSGPGSAAWVTRSPLSAAEDPAFPAAAAVRAPVLLAHVRRGSRGGRSIANTHPFAHGGWAMIHNGTVHGPDLAEDLPDRLRFLRGGTTDSEGLFLRFLAALLEDRETLAVPLAEAADVLGRLLRTVLDERLPAPEGTHSATGLNVVVSNGEGFVATRHGRSLHRRATAGGTLVASEPLGAGAGWSGVPEGSLLLVRGASVVERRF